MFRHLAFESADDLVFGRCPRPLRCGFGVELGNGSVAPEVNFTLPAMTLCEATWSQAVDHYRVMATEIVGRALFLKAPALVLEFEHLPPMTERAEWGAEITALLLEILRDAQERHGLASALRVTVVDTRLRQRPPRVRSDDVWLPLEASLRACAGAGAHILSIESEGGKEVCDAALTHGDVDGVLLALGVLAPADMDWLWTRIVGICRDSGAATMAGGDAACAFANTAMQLANQRMLPETFAAVVRAIGAVRGLAAYERGAVGPWKDCGYEGIILKAITGSPISMEGKSASCAHQSPVGNIAAAACDLWSNESVQHVRLLSGGAPAAFAETLLYDCRLMNAALSTGNERVLRDLLVESDVCLSPQAAILSPQAAFAIAGAIVAERTPYARAVAAGSKAVELLRNARDAGRLVLSAAELAWLQRIDAALCAAPSDVQELLARTQSRYGHLYDAASYGLQ
ncbi:MAG: hypothetical protein HY899_00095 [Deltaproteobacteria bacterium]|nr:hypothetical protein [Deltaproteobacteria bacterium]